MISPEPLANIFWLFDGDASKKVLGVGQEGSPLMDILKRRFSGVVIQSLVSFTRDEVALQEVDLLAFDRNSEGSDAFTPVGGLWGGRGLFRSFHAIVKPGGVLLIIESNPLWFRRLISISGLRASRLSYGAKKLKCELQCAGFKDISVFFADPDEYRAQSLVPDNKFMISLHQRTTKDRSAKFFLKLLLARVGMVDLIYPGRIILARS